MLTRIPTATFLRKDSPKCSLARVNSPTVLPSLSAWHSSKPIIFDHEFTCSECIGRLVQQPPATYVMGLPAAGCSPSLMFESWLDDSDCEAIKDRS